MRTHHIAQVNIALPQAPIDSPLLADFVSLLDPINELADRSPGFVWRLQTDEGNSTAIRAFDDERLIVNMSVWESIESLWAFVYDRAHLDVMRRRREWFERIRMHLCLWWVPAGHAPSVAEAESRLAHMRAHGPTLHAFTFKRRFGPPPSSDALEVPLAEREDCPA
jgi:Domain of unknown function (DUF3291)